VRKDSEASTAILELLKAVPRKVLLTGTPATAKLFDAFNCLDVLRPGLLGQNKYSYQVIAPSPEPHLITPDHA